MLQRLTETQRAQRSKTEGRKKTWLVLRAVSSAFFSLLSVSVLSVSLWLIPSRPRSARHVAPRRPPRVCRPRAALSVRRRAADGFAGRAVIRRGRRADGPAR